MYTNSLFQAHVCLAHTVRALLPFSFCKCITFCILHFAAQSIAVWAQVHIPRPTICAQKPPQPPLSLSTSFKSSSSTSAPRSSSLCHICWVILCHIFLRILYKYFWQFPVIFFRPSLCHIFLSILYHSCLIILCHIFLANLCHIFLTILCHIFLAMASVTNCFPPDLAALGRRRHLPTATDGQAIKPITSNNNNHKQ